MTAPIASGGSEIAGWALHPLESAALPRRAPITAVAVTAEAAPSFDPTATLATRVRVVRYLI